MRSRCPERASQINSVFTESEIIEKDEVNVGVAVALERGVYWSSGIQINSP